MADEDTLIAALGTVLSLQRWNFLPRVETWVEAENAVYVTQVTYALGRATGVSPEHLVCAMHRNLLKSLSKHFTTDVPVEFREQIKLKNPTAWLKLVDQNATRTGDLFPRSLSEQVTAYVRSSPSYPVEAARPDQARREAEDLIDYAHNCVALEECRVNRNVFAQEYGQILEDIETRLARAGNAEVLSPVYAGLHEYFGTIKRLKYLRRWNRINRVIPTSVLAHTYLVAILAVTLCWQEEATVRERHADWVQFQYQVTLRALFHDLPESLTGDVVTPVKSQLALIDDQVMPWLEDRCTTSFVESAPMHVQHDIRDLGLLKELDASRLFSVASMVKDCDRLALLLECAYEQDSGRLNSEMVGASRLYVRELRRSEWRAVRDFARSLEPLLSEAAEP